MSEIDEVAARSKLKGRSPETLESAIEAASDGQAIYVPADDLTRFFQSRNLAVVEGAERYGIPLADIEAQRVSGGAVAISKATYAARISGTDGLNGSETTPPLTRME